MSDRDINSPTAFDYLFDGIERVDYAKFVEESEQSYLQQIFQQKEELLKNAKVLIKAKAHESGYRAVEYTYCVKEGIKVCGYYGGNGYIVKIKTLSKNSVIDLAVLVIRLINRRVVFSILPEPDEKRMRYLRAYSYNETQEYLNSKGTKLESEDFETCMALKYYTTEAI